MQRLEERRAPQRPGQRGGVHGVIVPRPRRPVESRDQESRGCSSSQSPMTRRSTLNSRLLDWSRRASHQLPGAPAGGVGSSTSTRPRGRARDGEAGGARWAAATRPGARRRRPGPPPLPACAPGSRAVRTPARAPCRPAASGCAGAARPVTVVPASSACTSSTPPGTSSSPSARNAVSLGDPDRPAARTCCPGTARRRSGPAEGARREGRLPARALLAGRSEA